MEFGECSSGSNSSSNEVWAKLVPSDSRYSDVEIRSNEMVICSEITSSSLEKHDWCKITRNSDQSSAMMQNKSSNTILVDEATVQNEDDVVINCGSEIIPGPARQGYLSYRFKLMPRESFTRWLKVCIDAEHAKCSICLNVWHDVVTVAPCLHNFCNGCFSEWLRRSQERHASVLCPQCRAVVQFAGRNHFLRNIEEDVLQADSSLKRSDEEITLLDSYASIKSNLVIQTGKKQRRKRPHPILDAENEVADFPCPQCGNSFNFFYNYLLINHIIFWNTGTFGRKTVRSILKEEKYEPISGAQVVGFIFYNGVPYTQLLKLGSSGRSIYECDIMVMVILMSFSISSPLRSR
uniref:RING-type domain-containing protein n=1 Tax=Salix viminalis TaxID=40686 RepID=A0A6N2NLX9_SALVM